MFGKYNIKLLLEMLLIGGLLSVFAILLTLSVIFESDLGHFISVILFVILCIVAKD